MYVCMYVYDYVHVHADLENNHEERLQEDSFIARQRRDREMKEEEKQD